MPAVRGTPVLIESDKLIRILVFFRIRIIKRGKSKSKNRLPVIESYVGYIIDSFIQNFRVISYSYHFIHHPETGDINRRNEGIIKNTVGVKIIETAFAAKINMAIRPIKYGNIIELITQQPIRNVIISEFFFINIKSA